MSIYKGTTKIADTAFLPSQTGQSGKFLTTNGTTPSWQEIPTETDDVTISLNTNDELQAIGVIDTKTSNADKMWTGTLAEYEALTTKDANTFYHITDDEDGGVSVYTKTEVDNLLSSQMRVIGEIFPVACVAGFVPNGTLPCDGSEYAKGMFSDLWTNYLTGTTPKLLTCTYVEYAADITAYGECAKFAVDTTNEKFKTPTIKDGAYITQAKSDSEVGEAYNESLPNISGTLNISIATTATGTGYNLPVTSAQGAFSSTETGTRPYFTSAGTSTKSDHKYGSTFDASNSNSTYQDNAPVQGNNIRLRYFVQVANGNINQSQMDWSAWYSSLANKADKNLANTGEITNCILEDPQNINLTLSNGTLTLKAGSVVCVPNGFESDGTTPKFDEVTISSDVTLTGRAYNDIICYDIDNGTLVPSTANSSGSSTSSTTEGYFYNTSTNLIYRYHEGVTNSGKSSLPLCFVSNNGTTYTSIDQTFQSIGYIGSTVFVRKGLKVLIPNGRNDDGSLKNIEQTINSVLTYTTTSTTGEFYIQVSDTYVGRMYKPSWTYYPEYNLIKDASDNIAYKAMVGQMTISDTTISNFKPYTATNILKYSDSSQISGWAMPSSKYINLTLGASGSTYTAPANGWVTLYKLAGAVGEHIMLQNVLNGYSATMTSTASSATNQVLCAYIPVKKGNTFEAAYNATGATGVFRFTYAEGEQ